ncbi:MAG: TlyA family RNA methyltransferase [Chloroflexi bacterium]|nr:TlyA family RNA methyltransferase [Chloroflexota bacterium]
MVKKRLDVLLAERGLARSRTEAQRLTQAGAVRVDGQLESKPGAEVDVEAALTVAERPRYVGRGGEKLAAALDAFGLDIEAKIAADVGASTGGFTDCLLQHGARRVYAIDVGYGQLDWGLRNDSRVVVMERTNARYITVLPEVIDIAAIDVSFISLRVILPVVAGWLADPGEVIALVKPQFEAGRREVRKGGVVRDAAVHRRVLREVVGAAQACGLALRGMMRSPLQGPAGNTEFLCWFQRGTERTDVELRIEECTD